MVLPEGSLHVCGPHQVWPLRSECCGRGVPTKVVCAECMKMCCLGGKNSVVKGLISNTVYVCTCTSSQPGHCMLPVYATEQLASASSN